MERQGEEKQEPAKQFVQTLLQRKQYTPVKKDPAFASALAGFYKNYVLAMHGNKFSVASEVNQQAVQTEAKRVIQRFPQITDNEQSHVRDLLSTAEKAYRGELPSRG